MKYSEPWYYDCDPQFIEEEPRFLWIERFYCFDWGAFSDADHKFLKQVYTQLPSWVGYGSEDCAECSYWFGNDESKIPYLSTWEEIPYLQVNGILLPEDWEAWDGRFRSLVGELPKRKLTRR